MECEEVEKDLVDGGLYTLMVKSGTDGQSGRGNFAWKDKTVSDNKWLVDFESNFKIKTAVQL